MYHTQVPNIYVIYLKKWSFSFHENNTNHKRTKRKKLYEKDKIVPSIVSNIVAKIIPTFHFLQNTISQY